MTDKQELMTARIASASAVVLAYWMGMNTAQLGFVAQVVAFAFGLARHRSSRLSSLASSGSG